MPCLACTPVARGLVSGDMACPNEKTPRPQPGRENPMRPVIAHTVSETTAPDIDADWIFSADK